MNWMKQLVCGNPSRGTSSTVLVTDCLKKTVNWVKFRWNSVWETQWSGTISLEKATAFLVEVFRRNKFNSQGEDNCRIKLIFFFFFKFRNSCQSKRSPEGIKNYSLCSGSSVDVENIGTTCTTGFTSSYISRSEAFNHQTTSSYLLTWKTIYKSYWLEWKHYQWCHCWKSKSLTNPLGFYRYTT